MISVPYYIDKNVIVNPKENIILNEAKIDNIKVDPVESYFREQPVQDSNVNIYDLNSHPNEKPYFE